MSVDRQVIDIVLVVNLVCDSQDSITVCASQVLFVRFILVILLPDWPDELARNEGRYSLRGKPTKRNHSPNIILCDIEWLAAGLCFRHAGTAILSI